MNLDLPVELKNLDFNLVTILFGIYMIAIGVAYYFIFHKHHKKNKVELDELISLVTKFYVTTIITTIAIVLGISCIIGANTLKDTRSEMVMAILFGIIIITIAIINYVFYIKKNLKDLDQEIREKVRKATIRVGEILELIFFTIFILMPLWRIPAFIEVIDDKKELIKELVRAFGLCIAALILLNAINPVDIKGKLNNLFTKKDKKLK